MSQKLVYVLPWTGAVVQSVIWATIWSLPGFHVDAALGVNFRVKNEPIT